MISLQPIAHFQSPFSTKFGIPKQSGLARTLGGRIVFEPPFRNADCLRGLDEFDFLWMIWEFSANPHAPASPLVRPPLLGGNETRGVFATRSPFRPNPIGLSSVKIEKIEWETPDGPVIHVSGADLMDRTPIYDIKPYIEYADSHTNIRNGFVDGHTSARLNVHIPETLCGQLSERQRAALEETLSLDPRPRYQHDNERIYGFEMFGRNIRFRVNETDLHVISIDRLQSVNCLSETT